MKTFSEFLEEARTYTRTRSKEDAAKILASKFPDSEERKQYRLKNRQSTETPLWGHESKEKQTGQQRRRAENLKPISYNDLLAHAKRNLYPNPEKLAKRSLRDERTEKGSQTRERNKLTKETGIKHEIGHITPQPDRRSEPLRQRFRAIQPGDAAGNRKVEGAKENREKNSKNTSSTPITRGGVIAKRIRGTTP